MVPKSDGVRVGERQERHLVASTRTKAHAKPAPASFPGEATKADRNPLSPRDRIVEVAREMFCRDGIHATGIDKILAAAGASKMTLYSRFGSKEALLREVLALEGAAWRDAFFTALDAVSPDAATRLAHAVGALGAWFQGERFYGCAFMNAVAEHTKGEPWLRELAGQHHRQILEFLGARAAEAGYVEPAIVARQILLVLDGAIAALMVSGDPAILTLSARNLDAILAQAPKATS